MEENASSFRTFTVCVLYWLLSYFSWLNKNERRILDVGPIRTEGPDLLFDNPQQIDSGNYTFIVNNTAGEKRQNVWIIVSGRIQYLP